jgi:hypothetical protein
MKKVVTFRNTWFSPEVIREALAAMEKLAKTRHSKVIEKLDKDKHKDVPLISMPIGSRTVATGSEIWYYDSDDDFFYHYRDKGFKADRAMFNMYHSISSEGGGDFMLDVDYFYRDFTLGVSAPSRSEIQAISEVFERSVSVSKLPKEDRRKPIIFIGHGRNSQWRDLKDHLHDKHGYQIEAYETGARAGHTIRDILDSMLNTSSLALLIMTGEDEAGDGTMRARQNVIHEIGLFQAKLGWTKAIVLIEEDTEDFSNLQGINQIHYSKNNIKETYGEVLATIRREFNL